MTINPTASKSLLSYEKARIIPRRSIMVKLKASQNVSLRAEYCLTSFIALVSSSNVGLIIFTLQEYNRPEYILSRKDVATFWLISKRSRLCVSVITTDVVITGNFL